MPRRRKPQDEPKRRPGDPGAVILSGAGATGPVGPDGKAAGVVLESEPLVIDLDARALVDIARREILGATSENIREGRRPDGGPQRPLSKRAAADPRRVSDKRGFNTGHMADELRATPIKGDSSRAESTVQVPTDRNVFIGTEAKRGIRYLGIGPAIAAAVERATAEAVRAMAEGRRVEAEQGEPKGGEERDG